MVCGHGGPRHRGPDATADSTVRGACSRIQSSSFGEHVRGSNTAPCSGIPPVASYTLNNPAAAHQLRHPVVKAQQAQVLVVGGCILRRQRRQGLLRQWVRRMALPPRRGCRVGRAKALRGHAGAHKARWLCRLDHHGTTTRQPSTSPAPHPVAPGGRPQSAPSSGTGGSCSSGRSGSCTAGSVPPAAASSLPSASLSLGSATGCCALAAR